MPNNQLTALVLIGGVALLIGLLGGGIEINQIKLPQLRAWQRLLAFLIGSILIVLGLVLDPNVSNPMAVRQAQSPTMLPTEQPLVSSIATPSIAPSPLTSATPSPSTTSVPTSKQVSNRDNPDLTSTNSPESTTLSRWTNPVDGANYVYVLGGEFWMGEPEEDSAANDDAPEHLVFVEGFWIMETEVTNGMFKQCVDANQCKPPPNTTWNDPGQSRSPVTHISWMQAVQYADWVGGRLPTEAEWEKACRGEDRRTYPWGNEIPNEELIWAADDETAPPIPVGQYTLGASPYGVLDMAGSVWEWTSSKWGSATEKPDFAYPYNKDDGRESMETEPGMMRILRGGGAEGHELLLRCTFRNRDPIDSHVPVHGFRIAIDRPF